MGAGGQAGRQAGGQAGRQAGRQAASSPTSVGLTQACPNMVTTAYAAMLMKTGSKHISTTRKQDNRRV